MREHTDTHESTTRQRGRRWRRRALLATAAAVACVAGVSAAAEARDRGRWVTVKIEFGVEGYDFTEAVTFCDPAAPANCISTSTAPGYRFTGDLVGTGIEARAGAVAGTNLAYVPGVGMFSGTVKGCGTGTFVYLESTTFDLNTNTGDTTYTIARGTGTGDLVGISGRLDAAGGPVRCHPH